MELNWQDIAAMSVVWTALTGLLLFLLRPVMDRNWVLTLKRSKAEVMSVLNGWYDVKEQGEVFRQLKQNQAALLQETQEQSAALEAITHEVHQISLNVANLYGALGKDPWDGQTDRRRR